MKESNDNILSGEIKYDTKILNHLDTIQGKINGKYQDCRVGVLELHPTDNCNLYCNYCTFGKREPSNIFPFSGLDMLEKLQPKAVFIAGGGEPTTYNSEGKNFNDLIHRLKEILPHAKFALTTNGQEIPKGDWLQYIDRLRVSIDTSSTEIFNKIKGGELQKSIDSLAYYLKAGVPIVGAGFVFNKYNIDEVYSFINLMFKEVFNKAGQSVRKNLNLQFRPTCRIESCECPSPIYKNDTTIMVHDKTSTEWGDTIKKMKGEIEANSNKEFQKFIKDNTNMNKDTSINHNNSNPLFHYNNHQLLKFDKCYISLARTIVRANGDMYPCVIKASNEINPKSNILINSAKKIYKDQMNYFNSIEGYCKGTTECCIINGRKNDIVMKVLNTPSFQVPAYSKIDKFF